jgi:hypothetical protein
MIEFESHGTLSLWIGRFDGEDDLFAYVDFVYDEDGNGRSQFALDAGLEWFDHDFQEAHFAAAGLADPAPELAGFSWSSSFIAGAAAAIASAREEPDNAIFILYNCAYNPAVAQPRAGGRLRFVAALPYDQSAG